MTDIGLNSFDIAVLLPCYNEGAAIAQVVLDFRRALPGTRIFVYDNNSTDNTAEQAARAGATVVPSRRQGKGNVVRQICLLYTSPSPRDRTRSRMPSSA